MKVAIANWTAQQAGGAESYLSQIVPALTRQGHEVFFWCEEDGSSNRADITGLQGVPRSSVSGQGLLSALAALTAWLPDVVFSHGMVEPEHEQRLLSIAPGVYFGHNYYGTCISGTKAVSFPSERPCGRKFGPMCLLHFYPRRCGGLNPMTAVIDYRRQSTRLENLRRYRAIVTLSEHMRREFLHHGFLETRVRRLPAIGPDQEPPAPAAARDVTRLAFIGRLVRLKGCHILLDALQTVRSQIDGPIDLTIAGDGPDLERCRTLAAEVMTRVNGLRVNFLGWVSETTCAEVLCRSDLLVVPSIWPEPFGLVGLEAIQRSVPVVAFAVGGIPEWLEDGKTGVLAPADPPTAAGLACAIVTALTSADITRTVRERFSLAAHDYSVDSHVAALLPVLQFAASDHVDMPAGRAL